MNPAERLARDPRVMANPAAARANGLTSMPTRMRTRPGSRFSTRQHHGASPVSTPQRPSERTQFLASGAPRDQVVVVRRHVTGYRAVADYAERPGSRIGGRPRSFVARKSCPSRISFGHASSSASRTSRTSRDSSGEARTSEHQKGPRWLLTVRSAAWDLQHAALHRSSAMAIVR